VRIAIFVERLAARSEAVLATVIAGDDPALAALESALAVSAEDLKRPLQIGAGAPSPLFVRPRAEKIAARNGAFDFFSAPGEGLETVENRAPHSSPSARRKPGVRSGRDSIAQRGALSADVEDALRRAGVPAYFSHAARGLIPAGGVSGVLACASERLSASRFAEYLSLGSFRQKLGSGMGAARGRNATER